MLFVSCTNTPWHRQQAELFLNKGIALLQAKHYNNALKELLEAEKYSSSDPRIHYYLGITYIGKDMKEKAEEEFRKAISLQNDYSEAHNYLGTLYLDRGLFDKAISEFDQALNNPIYDTPALPLYNSGIAYFSIKDYNKALAKFRSALLKDPMTVLRPQIEKNMGLIYVEQSNLAQAIYHFKNAIELDASLYDVQFFLGESYLKMKDNGNAIKAFKAVVQLAPQSSFGQRAKIHLKNIK